MRRFDWKIWLPIVFAVGLAAIPFIYGKMLEFGTDGPFDGGMNVYTAQQILNGGRLNVDVAASARPATLLVNVIGVALFGFNETGPKLIQMLMQLAGLGLMFYALRKIYGVLPAAVALVLAAFFLSCPPYAKFGNVKEQFMVACMLVAVAALMLRHAGGAWWWLLISGGAAINCFFFKPTGASVIAALMVYVIAQPLLRRRSLKQFGSDVGLLLAGGLLGLLPLMIFAVQQHRLAAFLREIPGVAYIFPAPGSAGGGGLGGEYIAGSRQVSDFKSQWADVFRYYHSFTVPIGVALFAIGIWGVSSVRNIIGKLRNFNIKILNSKQYLINPNQTEINPEAKQSKIQNPKSNLM